MIKQHYRKSVGMWCRLLHRISGVVLMVFIAINGGMVVLVSRGEQPFNHVMRLIQSPVVLAVELAMLLAVLFHVCNGIRILFVNSGWWVEDQKDMAYTAFAIVIIAFLLHALPVIEQYAGMVFFK